MMTSPPPPPSSLTQAFVQAGACVDTTSTDDDATILRCVLESSQCDSDANKETFWSFDQVPRTSKCFFAASNTLSLLDTPYPCNTTSGGKCTVEKYHGHRTFFDYCEDTQECVWSAKTSCQGNVIKHHSECRCEQVLTGSCEISQGNYHCAVSADGCSSPELFRTVEETRNEGGVDCRLCVKPKAEKRMEEGDHPRPDRAKRIKSYRQSHSAIVGSATSEGGIDISSMGVFGMLGVVGLLAVVMLALPRIRRRYYRRLGNGRGENEHSHYLVEEEEDGDEIEIEAMPVMT